MKEQLTSKEKIYLFEYVIEKINTNPNKSVFVCHHLIDRYPVFSINPYSLEYLIPELWKYRNICYIEYYKNLCPFLGYKSIPWFENNKEREIALLQAIKDIKNSKKLIYKIKRLWHNTKRSLRMMVHSMLMKSLQ
jgi:hypothetical protein